MRNTLLLVAARLLLASLFIPAGVNTLRDIAGSAGYFGSLGFPLPTFVAWGTGLFELAAGVAVLIGFHTRLVAVALALFSLSAGYIGHYGQGGDNAALAFLHAQAFAKDVAIAGGLFALAAAGAGAWSIDARRERWATLT